jgi:hypothetical protein
MTKHTIRPFNFAILYRPIYGGRPRWRSKSLFRGAIKRRARYLVEAAAEGFAARGGNFHGTTALWRQALDLDL